jgi:hypothetical protein
MYIYIEVCIKNVIHNRFLLGRLARVFACLTVNHRVNKQSTYNAMGGLRVV